MKLGNLDFEPIEEHLSLVGKPTAEFIRANNLTGILTVAIDPSLSDTAAFCEKYDIGLGVSVNCVIVEAKRAERTWYAAIMICATDRADINNIVRHELDARKISFAPMDTAVSLSGMEYGGICPIGLPTDWPILVDDKAAKLDHAIIGSGVRASKLLVSGTLLSELPNTKVLNLVKQ